MWMLVHPAHLVMSRATLLYEIFLYSSFLIKNHVVVSVPSTPPAKWISFRNHRNRKVVGGKHNVLVHYVNASAINSSSFVLWNPFRWVFSNHIILCIPSIGDFCCCSFLIKILHNSKMNFKTYPYPPVGVCCIETPTNHLHTTFVVINN